MYKTKYNLAEDYKIIYTDGSKKVNSKSVGIGIVIEEQEIAYNISIDKNSSIFTAEAMAIKMALDCIIDLKENKDILVLIDSQSVCKRIASNRIERNQNNNIVTIRERIDTYIKNNKRQENKVVKIIIGWVPGHKDIKGNEIAEKLAKEASEKIADIRIEVPSKDWHYKFKEEMYVRTRSRVEAEGKNKGKKCFELYYDEGKRNCWFKKLDIERGLCTMINRLRANHYNLNESLERIGYINDPMCECGVKIQDIYHVVFECELLKDARNKMYRDLQQQEEKYLYDLNSWLRNIKLGPLSAVWRLLKEGGFIIQEKDR